MSDCEGNWKIRIKLVDGENYVPYVNAISALAGSNTLIVKENVDDKGRYYPHIQGFIKTDYSERKLRSIIKSLFDGRGNQKYSLSTDHDNWLYYRAYLVKNIKHIRYKTEILLNNENDIEELYELYLKIRGRHLPKSKDMTREEALFNDLKAYLSSSVPREGNKRTLLRYIVQYYKERGKVLHKIEIARLLETYVNYTQGVSEEWIDSVLVHTAYADEIYDVKNCTRCTEWKRCDKHKCTIIEEDVEPV